jgi:endonuclease/exonuclease/phosphatase family metal-dependent hydrolase
MPAFLPKPPVESGNGPEITVLTYNILAINRNIEAVAQVIREADADIVAVQEANIGFQTYARIYMTEQYPHIAAYLDPLSQQYDGRMILSKYPIRAFDVAPGYARTVLYLRAEIEIENQLIAVYSVHLYPATAQRIFSTEKRHGDLQVLLNDTAQDTLPVLLVGDFNMTDVTADYRQIAARYSDAYRERSRTIGTTHPNGGVLHHHLQIIPGFIRIDYVFHDDNLTALEAQVIRKGSSDHFPLWARVRLDD